ncbi:Ribonuclease [Phytophthora megakarya]|uniref:Ribonuclease n=1 Tax=Phytophthora megakarya TaxID=4795 RepID=A0A225URE2_9STRA|nr:Ribonuclease [Phytophthora megakarya]
MKLPGLLTLVLACVEAIDYPGGWLPNGKQCVDICMHVPPVPMCPTRDPSCVAKLQEPGDFDFLLLEQLFLPQFCRDLLAGVDLTISHRNVNKYPHGIVCDPSKAVSKLSIHGLWPSYNHGMSACCNVSDVIRNQPFDALGFAAESSELLREMDEVWIDPTQPSSFHTLCELYNHEFQKHGLCYAANGGSDFEFSAREYFKAALRAAAVNEEATATVSRWAAASKPKTTVAAITALYQTRVQVLCSAVAPFDGSKGDGVGNRLAAIHQAH